MCSNFRGFCCSSGCITLPQHWQVRSPLWQGSPSPYFPIQLLPATQHVFLSFQDFLSRLDKGLDHYHFFPCGRKNVSSTYITFKSHVHFLWNPWLQLVPLKLPPDYLLTTTHHQQSFAACLGYSMFTLTLPTSAGRTTDSVT